MTIIPKWYVFHTLVFAVSGVDVILAWLP